MLHRREGQRVSEHRCVQNIAGSSQKICRCQHKKVHAASAGGELHSLLTLLRLNLYLELVIVVAHELRMCTCNACEQGSIVMSTRGSARYAPDAPSTDTLVA